MMFQENGVEIVLLDVVINPYSLWETFSEHPVDLISSLKLEKVFWITNFLIS